MIGSNRTIRCLGALLAGALAVAACGGGSDGPPADDNALCGVGASAEPVTVPAPASSDGLTLTLVTHDAFAVSDGIFDAFTAETGVTVEVVETSDVGTMVGEAILTAGDPVGDVLYGIDNTFLCRGLRADLFVPYESPALATVPAALQLDDQHRVTPIDRADVCVNFWVDAVPATPTSMDDLIRPEFAGTFVTQNPETSSPGLAFLLATVARYGEDGWEDYWRALAANDLEVTPGWTEAYTGSFVAGGGERSIVTSYASSPVAEVVFADPPRDTPPTAILADSCVEQIEFAGILRGTDQPAAAARLVDFLLSDTFQADMPLNMFVFPASRSAPLPEPFAAHAAVPADPLRVDPERIEERRDDWTERWTEIVLG